jgi:hypothetical protein
MYPWSVDLQGRYEELTFESEVLKGNPLGDPYKRPLWVYLPPGYGAEPGRRYPTVYQIQGLTGQLSGFSCHVITPVHPYTDRSYVGVCVWTFLLLLKNTWHPLPA